MVINARGEETDMFIHIDGRLVRKNEAVISPFDHGYLYGVGLFETLRVYRGHPFLLLDHIERLRTGLRLIGIEHDWSLDDWKTAIAELLHANGYDSAYIRINVSAGQAELGLTAEPYKQSTTIIFSKPLSRSEPFLEKEGVVLRTKRNTPEASFRLKSHHFLNNVLAKREIGNAPNREGIFLDERGHVAEGIVSNLFWVKGGVVYTPSLQTGILNGVTRQFVCCLLKQKGIEVKEGFFPVEHLYAAEEAFMTNSIQEIVPFATIDRRHFPGNKGKITQMLKDEYQTYRETLLTYKELEKGVEIDGQHHCGR